MVSELAGRGNLRDIAERLHFGTGPEQELAALQELKAREARGYAYEAAEASAALLLLHRSESYQTLFEVVDY